MERMKEISMLVNKPKMRPEFSLKGKKTPEVLLLVFLFLIYITTFGFKAIFS